MQVIGLIIFLLIAFYVLRFVYSAFKHIFTVMNWVGEDAGKVFDGARETALSAYEKIEYFVRARAAAAQGKPKPFKPVRLQRLKNFRAKTKPVADAKAAEPETVPGAAEQAVEAELTAQTSPPPPEFEEWTPPAESPAQEPFKETPNAEGVPVSFIMKRALVGAVFTTMKLALWVVDCALRAPYAFKAGFPSQSSILFAKIAVCVLPISIMTRIPDIYGYGHVLNAVQIILASYILFIAAIYFLRITVPFDIEAAYSRTMSDERQEKESRGLWNSGKALYLVWFSVVALHLFEASRWGVPLLFLFFALAYALMPGWKNRPKSRALRYIPAAGIIAAYAALLVKAPQYLNPERMDVFLLMITAMLAATATVYLYWRVIAAKMETALGRLEPPAKARIWTNFFVAPMLQLYFLLPGLYFILMFHTLNTAFFFIAAVALSAGYAIWRKGRKYDTPYARPGLFPLYILLLWTSIIYVQSYNQIAPSAASCASLKDDSGRRCLLSMDEYRRLAFLSGSLPYETIMDAEERALFVSFKNIFGHGSVLRLDSETGDMTKYVIAENEKSYGQTFYPERLCANRETKKLYATVKTAGNFQLLEMDYAGGGLSLSDRIRFGNLEVTNCEVDPADGLIYAIFLGPPDSRIIGIDGITKRKQTPIRFGSLGYADYFALDAENDRLVVPSLDPMRLFDAYEVRSLKDESGRKIIRRPLRLPAQLPGGRVAGVPLPSFGIAADPARNLFYFTCPFLKMVFAADADSFRVVKMMPVGNFPRKLAFNRRDGLLLVANYSGGSVDMIDVREWKRLKRTRVGKLVRSVSVDEESGRNFAVTACGVYELFDPRK